jgi:MoaA/NifB/PqqE/SkfB family radical SAM enzyme
MNDYVKSDRVLAYPSRTDDGWFVKEVDSGTTVHLNDLSYACWRDGEWRKLAASAPFLFRQLVGSGMILPAPPQSGSAADGLDARVPCIAGSHVKFYAESCDLVILFNTAGMPQNNPLLVLGPYGSLCWNLVLQGKTVSEIRCACQHRFGADHLLPFLARLAGLGFIAGLDEPASTVPESKVMEFPAPQVQFELMRTRIPWYVIWELCTTCDLRCKTCYLPEFDNTGAVGTDLQLLVRRLVEGGIFYVGLLGGEVLLRADLEDLVGLLRDSGVFVKIITNGQKLDLARARSLVQAGLNQIEVSFDGLTPQSHDPSRGPGTFRKACAALQAAAEAGVPRRAVVWTLHTGNCHEIDHLGRFLSEAGVEECYISTFRKTGLLGAQAPWNPLTESQSRRIHDALVRLREEYGNLTITLSTECSCGRSSIVVSPDGALRLCTFSRDTVGNLKEEPLAQIWQRLDEVYVGKGPFGYCRSS